MPRRIATMAGAASSLLFLILLTELLLPGVPQALAQGTIDLTGVVTQLTQLNTKSDQLNQLLTQQLTQLSTASTQANQALTQLNASTAQLSQTLDGVRSQTERIAARLEQPSVNGVGYVEVRVPPDLAIVQINVKSQAATLDGAVAQNQAAVTRVRAQIGGAPINAADPEIAPIFGEERAITGYRVLTPLLVSIDDPNTSGAGTLAQVVKLSGSDFQSIKYQVKPATAQQAREDARRQAFEQATQHATLYAASANGSLGTVRSISEDISSKTVRTLPLSGEPTEQVYTAEVSVTYDLELP